MTKYSYDVTNPQDGIQTIQSPPQKTSKVIYFLCAILIILMLIIFYVVFFRDACPYKTKNDSSNERYSGLNTTTLSSTKEPETTRNERVNVTATEVVPAIDLRMMESSSEDSVTTKHDLKTSSHSPLPKSPDKELEKITCKSYECIHTSAHIISSMDQTVEACEDFYEYACGRMEVPVDEPLDIFNPKHFEGENKPLFLEKFRTFYESCVKHEDRFEFGTRINKTKLLLERIGSFNIDGKGNTDFNLTQFVANMILYNSVSLFNVDVDIDPANSTYIMKLLMPDQTSLQFDHWSSLSETKRKCLRETGDLAHHKNLNMTILYNRFLLCQKNYADYLESISTSMRELGFFSNLTEKEIYTNIRDIRVFIEFEILSKFDVSPKERLSAILLKICGEMDCGVYIISCMPNTSGRTTFASYSPKITLISGIEKSFRLLRPFNNSTGFSNGDFQGGESYMKAKESVSQLDPAERTFLQTGHSTEIQDQTIKTGPYNEIPLPPNLQEQNVKRKYENIKLGQLEKEFPLIKWEILFKVVSQREVTSNTIIQMYNRQYFEDVFREISTVDKTKLNNALLAILANSLFENTVLPVHRHSREEFCQDQSKELMPDIVNYLYKKVIKTEELKKQNSGVENLFQILKSGFKDSLQKQEWLDTESRISMEGKLNRIKLAMFSNDDIDSEKIHLEEAYKDLELERNDYQNNQFYLMEFRRRRLFSLHGEKVTVENMYRHFVDATKNEPVFFYANDIVCIPYGLAKKVSDYLPQYMNMAQVGFPIAKIIGRAFDRIGVQYGVNLTTKSSIAYNYFADQTRDMLPLIMNPIDFEDKRLYFYLNNDLSESERIADNTALRLMTDSFSSFEDQPLMPYLSPKYSREKIFFLFLTQGLCKRDDLMNFMVEAYESPVLPPQFRVENILQNSEEFSKLFGCVPGSGMSRSEDRYQFPYVPAIVENEIDDTL